MLRVVFGILTLVSLGLTCWRWLLARGFPLHQKAVLPPNLPGVSILKPLKGCDAETRACLRSWFEQQYAGPWQILFGVAEPEDPVCAIVRELMVEFPNVNACLLICAQRLGANRKISTLRQLEPLITQPLVIVSDADTRVPPDYAAQSAAQCGDGVGLVNCFYRLANPVTMAMRWEAVAVNGDFWTHVLQSTSVKKIDFALGAVMTLPATELAAIGGFASLSDCLADDYELGNRIAARGRTLALAYVVAECWEPPMGWLGVWRHQLRWARTIRVCQTVPFFFSVLNNSSAWPLVLLGLSIPGYPGLAALGAAVLLFRMITGAQQIEKMSGKPWLLRDWWLIPAKDVLDLAIWALAFGGNVVEWRGERYRVTHCGLLERI